MDADSVDADSVDAYPIKQRWEMDINRDRVEGNGDQFSGKLKDLMPCIAQAAIGERTHLKVFGNDYPTPDGTGIRDHYHVMDLAEGHITALNYLLGASLRANVSASAGAAIGERIHLKVFGNDYPTPDGTGIRDHFHVMDLAEGHIAALNYLLGASLRANVSASVGGSAANNAAQTDRM